jgi:hypothetical protein
MKTADRAINTIDPKRSMKTKGATPNMNFEWGLSSFSSRTLAEKKRFKEVQKRDKKLMIMTIKTTGAKMEIRKIYLMLEEASKIRLE